MWFCNAYFEKFKVSLLLKMEPYSIAFTHYAIPSDGWKQDSNLRFGVVILPD